MPRLRQCSCVALFLAVAALRAPAQVTVVRYDLELRVDPLTRAIAGSALVELQALESTSNAKLALNQRFEPSAVERDDKAAAFTLGERIAEGRALLITLDPPLAAGARCKVKLEYSGAGEDPDESGADWMGIVLVRDGEIRMSHQAQWFPVVPRDELARSKCPAPTRLALDLPPGYESLGPGVLTGVKKVKNREVHTWTSERAVLPSILAGKYKAQAIKRDKVLVRVLSTPEHAAGAKSWAEDAAQSLDVLSGLFGKLEASHYGIGEMRVKNRSKSYNYEADGFSVYDGVLFDGRAPDVKKIAHEVAHLWFGGAVDATGEGERFLTEGLAEFAAWLALEARSGEAAAQEAAKKGLERYCGSPGQEHALVATDFSSPRYTQVAYAKGAFALRTLRAWIGADALTAGLRDYVARGRRANGVATLADFLAALRMTNAPAVEHWEQDWLRRDGVPEYSVTLTGDSQGVLAQQGQLYRNPVELELALADGTRRVIVVSPAALDTPWSSPSPSKVTSVTIDPAFRVLFRRP